MGLRDFITGIKITVPIEAIQKAIAGTFQGPGIVRLKMGGKYALAGEWWRISGIQERAVTLEPLDANTKVVEVGGR